MAKKITDTERLNFLMDRANMADEDIWWLDTRKLIDAAITATRRRGKGGKERG